MLFLNTSESTIWQIIARAALPSRASPPAQPSRGSTPAPCQPARAVDMDTGRTLHQHPDLRDPKKGPEGWRTGGPSRSSCGGQQVTSGAGNLTSPGGEASCCGRRRRVPGTARFQCLGREQGGLSRWMEETSGSEGRWRSVGLRHAPPVLACRHRHQPTEIKEKPLRPNPPHRVRGITSLVPVLQLTWPVPAFLGRDPGVPLYEASQCSKSRVIALTCR